MFPEETMRGTGKAAKQRYDIKVQGGGRKKVSNLGTIHNIGHTSEGPSQGLGSLVEGPPQGGLNSQALPSLHVHRQRAFQQPKGPPPTKDTQMPVKRPVGTWTEPHQHCVPSLPSPCCERGGVCQPHQLKRN